MISALRNLIRPVCPNCDGKGGHMDGYYQPEFSECDCCNPMGDNEQEPTRVWRWRWWQHRVWLWREERRWDRMIAEGEKRENWRSR